MSMANTNPQVESSYNAFGYDPFGLIAHLSHHFFGPEWQPTTFVHLKGLPITASWPQYGQPAPGQVDGLLETFVPQLPPLWHGTPSPPYIDGPLVFDPHIFAALSLRLPLARGIDPSRATCYRKIHGMEVMNGVYRVDVKFVTSMNGELQVEIEDHLSILSNILWEAFRLQVQQWLGIDSIDLFYSITDPLYAFKSGVKPLDGEAEWVCVMSAMKQAFEMCRESELEVIHKVHKSDKAILRSEELLEIETFYFEYPSFSALVEFMDGKHQAEHILNSHEHDLIRFQAGIKYLDDFTLFSATNLHTWTKIPMGKIRALYKSTEEMIRAFHDEKQGEIDEIQELRLAGHRIVSGGIEFEVEDG